MKSKSLLIENVFAAAQYFSVWRSLFAATPDSFPTPLSQLSRFKRILDHFAGQIFHQNFLQEMSENYVKRDLQKWVTTIVQVSQKYAAINEVCQYD